MALAAQPDLSTRLRSDGDGLRLRLERRESLLELLRGTSGDARSVRNRGLPCPVGACLDSRERLGGRRLRTWPSARTAGDAQPGGRMPNSAALRIGSSSPRSGADFYATDLRHDRRISVDVPAAVTAFPLGARGEMAGALVGHGSRDRPRSSRALPGRQKLPGTCCWSPPGLPSRMRCCCGVPRNSQSPTT